MRDATALVSVVVPVFNGADTIGRAIASVRAGTDRNFEIVAVDDGSTDGTRAALDRLAGADLRVVSLPRNAGPATARNAGIAAARGALIAFLDADDEWLPEKIARQRAFLAAAPADTRLCCTAHTIVDPAADAPARLNMPEIAAVADQARYLKFGCHVSPGSTLLAPRALFDEIGPYDESLRRFEDWDWLLRYVERYRIGVVPSPLARIHTTGRPEKDRVVEALNRLETKYLGHPAMARPGHWRRFRSSLLLERAAAWYHAGRPGRAIWYTLRSLAVFPARNRAFFARALALAWRLGARVLGRRGG